MYKTSERHREYMSAYRKRNREHLNAYWREYYKNNKERMKTSRKRCKARKEVQQQQEN